MRTAIVFAFILFVSIPALAAGLPEVEVWKDPNCGCCNKWITHLREAGFTVKTHNVRDTAAAREKLGMPHRYGACHSAKAGRYVVEGHVPAGDIKRLLQQQPDAIGIAVPGMPLGSPGMEYSKPEPYQTLLIDKSGKASVFAEH